MVGFEAFLAQEFLPAGFDSADSVDERVLPASIALDGWEEIVEFFKYFCNVFKFFRRRFFF